MTKVAWQHKKAKLTDMKRRYSVDSETESPSLPTSFNPLPEDKFLTGPN